MPFKILSGNVTFHRRFFPLSLSLTFEGSQTRQSPGNLITAMIPLISSYPHVTSETKHLYSKRQWVSLSVKPNNNFMLRQKNISSYPYVTSKTKHQYSKRQWVSLSSVHQKDSATVGHLSVKRNNNPKSSKKDVFSELGPPSP